MLGLLSIKDSLSDLFNHRYCFEVINKEYESYIRRKEKGMLFTSSILVMDIDFFKGVNDAYGHLVGDIVIKNVADIIRLNIRKTDIAFRFGGDEFVVFLQDSGLAESKKLAEKIRDVLEKTSLPINNNQISITVSIGVASFEEADNANEIFEIADRRLYISKESGRNRVT
jgi:diguanylate cyclase (GGDEF)-like protein